MAKAIYAQKGETLDYTNTTSENIEVGTVLVIGSHIGIAGSNILPNETGSVHMVGCFFIEKSSQAAVIPQGTPVFWDGVGITATAPTGSDGIQTSVGYTVSSSSAEDVAVLVKLNG